MAHHGLLRDYRFSADVDDIRGTDIYDAEQSKIGKVKDVIFDHDSGDIRYLVAEVEHDRRVLIPSDHVFRSAANDDSFGTDLTRERLNSLPAFNERVMESEAAWKSHHEESRRHWREREPGRDETLEREYDEKWHAAPVQHIQGSTHNITPEADEMPLPSASEGGEERIVTGADLTPHRIAGKFPGDRGPMVTAGTPNADRSTLRPSEMTERTNDSVRASGRWERFQEHLRRRAPELRQRCDVCCGGERRIA